MMASPQTEDGYTRISNELLEALARIRIPGEARQVLDLIIRKTYGFGKKEDAIALSQFVLGTGMKKPAVCRGIKALCGMGIIIKKDNAVAKMFGMIKDFDQWKPLSKKITTVIEKDNDNGSNKRPEQAKPRNEENPPLSKKITTVIEKDNAALSFSDTTKETITKETITKERPPAKIAIVIPDLLNCPEFIEPWEALKKSKREKRKPMSPTQEQRTLNRLADFGKKWSIDRVEACIMNGWQGVIFKEDKPEEAKKEEGPYVPELAY